ncbi:class I SAM-dependent methyltransferase [Qaidamihabitans albus]|uniref:class I SAM-dependent methyltransferase n=1 Tax=Qaidamihabitans albus TaxID=2795733 RepID=UPI0018F14863|nr:class I SAM-dependent methyltransferase [Qaidamihabitans albus]
MASIVNTEQDAAWNGYEGRYWADHQDRWDAVNGGYNERLLAAARIGERDHVLDVGCGNGQTTRLAARLAVLGSATGLDLSEPMLERARATAAAEGLANVTFERGDAQVHPFAPDAFDVAISRFGVMFFADPVSAFANIRQALCPGGRLAFVCLGDPRETVLFRLYASALGELLPRGWAEPGKPGPALFGDPARTREVLTAAGLADVRSEPADEVALYYGGDAADAAGFLAHQGPIRHFLRDAGESVADRVRAEIEEGLRPYETADGVWLTGAAWVVTATRSGEREERS